MKARFSEINRAKTYQIVFALILIALAMWIARYNRASEFGLYEDDWTFIPRVVDMPFSEVLEFVSNYILQFQGQGRPLHHSLIRIFAFVGWKIGGLTGIYFVGYLVVTGNAFLFYLLLKRLLNHSYAIVGALAYCLYSADTTQSFLTHSLGLHPSLTFFLLATHAYLSKKYILSYLLIFISLLTYETAFPLFFAAPLLANKWDRRKIKPLILHTAILSGFLLLAYVLRRSVEEERVAAIHLFDALSLSIRHMVQGPIYQIRLYYLDALQAFGALDEGVLPYILVSFILCFGSIFVGGIERSTDRHDSSRFAEISRLALIAVLLLMLGYSLTLTTEPDVIYGRGTRNHFAGIVGNAMLIAAIWAYLTQVLGNKWVHIVSALLFAAVFSVLVGFGQVVQRDYARAWQYQQDFWTELLALIPDAHDNTAIVVDPAGIKKSRHILANTWNTPRVLDRIYQIPDDWKYAPSVYIMYPEWLQFLNEGSGELRLDWPAALTPAEYIRNVSSDEMIPIFTSDGALTRLDSSIQIDGKTYPVKTISDPILQTLPHKPIYDALILTTDE